MFQTFLEGASFMSWGSVGRRLCHSTLQHSPETNTLDLSYVCKTSRMELWEATIIDSASAVDPKMRQDPSD